MSDEKVSEQSVDEKLKKIMPSAVNDEKNKKYEDEGFNDDIINSLFADTEEKEELDESKGKEQEEQQKKKEKVSTEKVIEETETKKEKPADDKIDSELRSKLDAAISENAELKAKITELQSVQEVITNVVGKDVNVDIQGYFKQLEEVNMDLSGNPEILDVISSLHEGKVPDVFKSDNKTVKDFMPDNIDFDVDESMTDSRSASYIAREKFEQHKQEAFRNRQGIVETFKKGRKGVVKLQAPAEAMESMQETLGKVKVFAKDHFDGGEELFEEYLKALSTYDPDLFKVQFQVFAKKNGVDSKTDQLIKRNKKKLSTEALAKTNERESDDAYGITEEQEKVGAAVFGDWD